MEAKAKNYLMFVVLPLIFFAFAFAFARCELTFSVSSTSWYASKRSTIMPIHKKNTREFEKAFIGEDGERYQLITVINVEQHTKQMKYNP